jgi:LEA14-like dessication related protein
MKNNKHVVLILVFIVSIVIGYVYLQSRKAMNYTYKLGKIKFDVIGLQKTKGVLNFVVSNPSRFKALIYTIDLQLSLNGVPISKLNTSDIEILPGSEFTIPFKFEFEPHKIFSIKNLAALQNILNPDKTIVDIIGKAKVKKWFFTFNFPIKISEPLRYYLSE